MISKKRKTWLLAVALILATTAVGQKRDIHILAVNDMHGAIEVFPKLAALVDSLRAEDPSLLIFSAGDNRTGNPLNDKYEISGFPMVALMNQVGFSGSTLGNHDFDQHSLKRLVGLSDFRYICANVFPDDTLGLHTVPCQVFDVEGLRVGVVGAVQLKTQGIPSTHPDNLRGISFKPARDVIGQYEWLSRECDVTILLSHLGYPDDLEMADTFPWIDLIIGGHTHTQLKGDEIRNGILVTQCKNKFGNVCYITLTVDGGRVVDKHAEYIKIKKYPKTNKLVEVMVRHFSDNPEFRNVLAVADTPFDVREEIGCMICDAYMDATHADVAIENARGVRIDSHPAGDITLLDVLEMSPFDNYAVVLNLTGDELVKLMLDYCHGSMNSFPYIRGLKCELTLDKHNPEMVKRVRLLTPDGRKANMKKKYRVATNSYIPAVCNLPEEMIQTLSTQTSDLVVRYLQKQGNVDYNGVRCFMIR